MPPHHYSLAHRHGSEEITLGLLYARKGNARILSTAGGLTMQEVVQALHLGCVCRSVTKQPVQAPLCADDGHHCWPLPWESPGWDGLFAAASQAVLRD